MKDYTHPSTDEFPDTTLPSERRHELKTFVRVEARNLSVHECMYLANAFETAARDKRFTEKEVGG